jgi:hypothetical protein
MNLVLKRPDGLKNTGGMEEMVNDSHDSILHLESDGVNVHGHKGVLRKGQYT